MDVERDVTMESIGPFFKYRARSANAQRVFQKNFSDWTVMVEQRRQVNVARFLAREGLVIDDATDATPAALTP
jgi:hypothetical protein